MRELCKIAQSCKQTNIQSPGPPKIVSSAAVIWVVTQRHLLSTLFVFSRLSVSQDEREMSEIDIICGFVQLGKRNTDILHFSLLH